MPVNEQLWNVAIEHRLMHAETLAYMLHQMPVDTKMPQVSSPMAARAVEPGMITIPAGPVTLGRSEGFGWDNEFDAHEVQVAEFAIDRYKVTNGDFLKFIHAGGYEDESLKWLTDQGIKHPVFWKSESVYRTMFEEIPMPLDWPVYVSHSEASAYARWVGKSLPTEAEWQRAAQSSTPWKRGVRTLGSGAGDGRCEHGRKRVGVDFHAVQAISGVSAVSFLSGLFGEFFRRSALRDEGRVGADGRLPVAPFVPELVPTALPIRL